MVDAEIRADAAFPAAVGKTSPQIPARKASLVVTWHPTQAIALTAAGRCASRSFGTIDNSDPVSHTYAGVHPTTIYKTRIKDAVFADQMQQAMDIGFDRLEALVLEHGGAGEPIELDPDQASAGGAAPEPFDFDRAMKVLVYRRAARAGEPNRRTGRPPKNATREETNAVLFKALAAAQRRAAAARGAEGALDQRSLGQEEPGNG